MEDFIKWEPTEAKQMQIIEVERTQVLAQIGALMMDLETAKRNLETVNDKHKSAIKQALNSRGITQFESARPAPGGIAITLPGEQVGKTNGGV